MECISVLYEQEIMAQHINYAILEDAYLIEASKEKKPFKERVTEIVNKVLTFIKKFFTETLPNFLKSLSNKLDKLTHETIKCTGPALIEKQYKLGVQTYDDYCKAIQKYHDGLMKKLNSNNKDESFEEYKTALDVNEFMENAGMKTVDELDNAPQSKHTANEFQRMIDNINSMSSNLNSKQVKEAEKVIGEINRSINSSNSDSSVYFQNLLKSATSISSIVTRLNEYLKFALNIFSKFNGTLAGYVPNAGEIVYYRSNGKSNIKKS